MAVNSRHPIAVLIDSVKEVEQWSDPTLVANAEAGGYKISKSRISQLRNEPVQTVSADNIRTLAAALKVPEARVVDAYLEAMGFPVREQPQSGVEEAIRADGRLSTDDKDTLLTLVRSMRRRTAQVGGGGPARFARKKPRPQPRQEPARQRTDGDQSP